jgi:hypothetical protein
MGSNGLSPLEQLREKNKCPDSPTKRKYHDSDSAWDAARESTSRNGLEIVAYACPGCGAFHLTKKVKGSDVVVKADVGITTGALRRLAPNEYAPPERVDMSEIVPGNRASREKTLDAYLEGKTEVTTDEVCILLSIGFSSVGRTYMIPRGWVNTKGRNARWVKEGADVNPIVPITPPPVAAIKPLEQSIARHPAKGEGWRPIDVTSLPPNATIEDLFGIYKAAGLTLELRVRESQ